MAFRHEEAKHFLKLNSFFLPPNWVGSYFTALGAPLVLGNHSLGMKTLHVNGSCVQQTG
jgi:hypothetical protein